LARDGAVTDGGNSYCRDDIACGQRLAARDNDYLDCGPSAARYFVKMVHNGVEYVALGWCEDGRPEMVVS
jgi:6-phosphogluconate dehydrogenase (decarboxylating)